MCTGKFRFLILGSENEEFYLKGQRPKAEFDSEEGRNYKSKTAGISLEIFRAAKRRWNYTSQGIRIRFK
jgi:hypothetical protein